MHKQTIFQVDAFADEPFKGNPAGVMIVDASTGRAWMQNVALEMNLSETAFIIPQEKSFAIRYFTPATEVPLCGHATLASAHILYETGMVSTGESILFRAEGGDLLIRKENEWIVMNFPAYTLTGIEVPRGFKEAVGFETFETYTTDYGWIIAVAESEQDIAQAKPDFMKLRQYGLGHLMITARGKSSDFVVRCFVPDFGIDEDPVTGSAHCALTPLWYEKTGKTEMESFQLSKRTGKLKVKWMDDRVEIKGRALTMFEADLRILPIRY